MAKTITMRVDDVTYQMFKIAAEGERRSISNFIEYATISYLLEEGVVSDREMEDILNNEQLLHNLEQGHKEIKEGKYRIVG